MGQFSNLEINFYCKIPNKKYLFKKNQKKLYQLLKEVTKELNLKDKFVVSLNLLESEEIKDLNKKYRNLNKTTDVLSFPQNESFDNIYDLGDIFINGELLLEQAKSINSDQDTEFCFLFMHGLLHLIGYDHLNIEDEKKMINRQKELFKKLKIRND
ncbi:MAG: endoribonuclease YbeY [Candidatus Hepatoplasma scabrum]|nr:MAG: endoribonuclease YbeY [Candidatus Hepatoplasma sp.]